jgi:hypothetical protein
VRSAPAGDLSGISALVVSEAGMSPAGGKLDDAAAGRIASLIGVSGGHAFSIDPERARGVLGLWNANLADYFPDEPPANSARVAVLVKVDLPKEFYSVLFRDQIGGFPNGLRFETDLDMGENSIINLASLGYLDDDGKVKNGFAFDLPTGKIILPAKTPERPAGGGSTEEGSLAVPDNRPAEPYTIDPAGVSVMSDIQLEDLGGAKLSEIMPKLSLQASYRDQANGALVPAPGFRASGGTLARDASADLCPAGYAPSAETVLHGTDTGTAQTAAAEFPGATCDVQTCQITTATTTGYSCPSGYSCYSGDCSSSSGQCYRDSTSSISATKSCPSGYALSGSSCVKTESCSCASGYSGPNSSGTCSKSTTSTTSASCSVSSSAAYHYQGVGNCKAGAMCSKSSSDDHGSTVCSQGYMTTWEGCTYSGARVSGCPPNGNPYHIYLYICSRQCNFTCYYCTCSSGTYNGGSTKTCTLKQTTTASCTCPSGYTRSDKTCFYSGTSTTSATYSCPSGYSLSGSACYITTRSYAGTVNTTVTVITSNSCPFTSYTSPPAPWSRTDLTGSTYTFKYATCPARPTAGSVPPDFTGRQTSLTPQTLSVGGKLHTSGWRLTLGGKASAANVRVYCRQVD